MQQVVYYLEKERCFSAYNITLSALQENEVLVEFLFCGICGSDYSHYIGLRNNFPISLGHEFIAKVLEIGNKVTGIRVGDLVASDLNYRCNQCIFCKQQQTHLCIDNNIELFSNRGFATHAIINYNYLVVANNLKSDIHGTLVEPLSCVIHAVSQVELKKCDLILVCGAGNIGTIMVFYLTCILGLNNVYVDDKITEKKRRVINLFPSKPHNDTIRYDVIFEATNSLVGVMSALSYAKYAREICSISHLYGINSSDIYEYIIKNEIKITFPLRNGNKATLHKAIKYITEYWNTSYDCIFEIMPLKNINELFSNKHYSLYNKHTFAITGG